MSEHFKNQRKYYLFLYLRSVKINILTLYKVICYNYSKSRHSNLRNENYRAFIINNDENVQNKVSHAFHKLILSIQALYTKEIIFNHYSTVLAALKAY